MKRITCTMLIILGMVAVLFAPAPTTATATGESGTVTGAARATFDQGAALGSVALNSLDFGTGMFIEPDGSGSGVFSAVLTGRSPLGQARSITIDGEVLRGALMPDGRAYFSGTARVNLGDGTPALSGIPFSVTTTANSVRLALDSTTLPTAQLVSGSFNVD
jgi:hypothetical protein